MPSNVYQIVSASTGSGVGAGNVPVITSGRIYAVVFRFRASVGASSGFYDYELSLQGTQAFNSTNDPQRTLIIAAATFGIVTNNVLYGNNAPIPVDVPIRVGDRLYLNTLQTGTAAASLQVAVNIYVKE